MKNWEIAHDLTQKTTKEDILELLFRLRGLKTKKEREDFIHPKDPYTLTPRDVDIDTTSLKKAIARIKKAIEQKESIVVYADYDADGITSGAIMWEALVRLGARAMPYIPHRVDEGYGLSVKGIDAVIQEHNPTLIITVDHGITARNKVAYAKKKGIDVIITDHHTKPEALPDCLIVHTTSLCGAGVSWFVAKEFSRLLNKPLSLQISEGRELLALSCIGTVADLVHLVGVNRTIVKHGLVALRTTTRVGLLELFAESGIDKQTLGVYDISHVLAPRLNAMGRIVHAMDALRLLCTKKSERAKELASVLGVTNKERQQMTIDTTLDARNSLTIKDGALVQKLIFVIGKEYNPGVIGLVAGKLTEEFYRPSVVVSYGEEFSRASARSISGFNIIEAIRRCSDILIDAGGHPMAAGFTVETKNLTKLKERLEKLAQEALTEEKLTRVLHIDAAIPLSVVQEPLWNTLQDFQPFGFGNPEPIFATKHIHITNARLVGVDGKHMRIRAVDKQTKREIDGIAFGLGKLYPDIASDKSVDVAYTIDMNVWNGNSKLQLKVKDITI
jgi:single-stranded-DNA-specific exonuclease